MLNQDSDAELVKRAIEFLRVERRKWARCPRPLWQRTSALFGFLGEERLSAICVRHGFDPNEIYK